jgi:hypothetical protein
MKARGETGGRTNFQAQKKKTKIIDEINKIK